MKRINIEWVVPTAGGLFGLICFERSENGTWLLIEESTADVPSLVKYVLSLTA